MPLPDFRIFPKSLFGDGDKDFDRDNCNQAYSRLIWEVEYKNRNPMDMRKNGHRLMKSPYNRLYLAAKIYGPDPGDGETEAAMVLWGRTGTGGGNNDDDDIKVIEAVSFGTKDLSEEHKNDFAARADAKTLVAVEGKKWRRPPLFPPNYPRRVDWRNNLNMTAYPGLLLDIPLEGIFYKFVIPADDAPGIEQVAPKKYMAAPWRNGANKLVSELKIDLRALLNSVLDLALAHGRTDASASSAVAGADDGADDGAGGTLGGADGGADGAGTLGAEDGVGAQGADGAGTLGADGQSSQKKARTKMFV
jgi:hypothetical protein